MIIGFGTIDNICNNYLGEAMEVKAYLEGNWRHVVLTSLLTDITNEMEYKDKVIAVDGLKS